MGLTSKKPLTFPGGGVEEVGVLGDDQEAP